MKIKFECVLFWMFVCPLLLFGQSVYINEFLASNSASNRDPDFNEYADWIEIYNGSSQMVNIGDYFLSDDLNDQKWKFPASTSIGPLGFLLVWADGLDTSLTALHTNFKLSKSGETIALFGPDSSLLDTLTFSEQTTDYSFGRQPDGTNNWYSFTLPTPGQSNNSAPFLKTENPAFSLKSGFYNSQQILEMSSPPHTVIRYTTDCSSPTELSPLFPGSHLVKNRDGDANYFSEILTTLDPEPWLPDWVPPAGNVFKATVIRARAFQDGKLPSDIVTKTYFVGPDINNRYPTMAVVSLVSDYQNLFDDATGIYVPGNSHVNGQTRSGNYFQNWEKPAHITFFETGGDLAFSQDVGIRIQGGTSQVSPQKGLHIIADNKYGKNRIEYPIFKNTIYRAKELKEFKRFILRSWGSTIGSALFNDAYAHALMADSNLDLNAYRPAVVFINGEFWGLHEIREANKNSWYYQYHYDINREDPGFDILEHTSRNDKPYASLDEGDKVHWNAMLEYMSAHDMSLPENYEYIKTQMDVDNFIDYIGHCVYLVKWDWPNNNEASWRPHAADGRWRWIQYDMETSFGIAKALSPLYQYLGAQYDMINNVVYGNPIPGFGQYGPQPILKLLLANEEFRNEFVRWFYIHMEKEFAPENMISLLDEMAAEIRPYMQEYRFRWPFEMAMNSDWDYHLELIRDFARTRPAFMKQHLANEFGEYTGVRQAEVNSIPVEFRLFQNYPNPFNGSTTINYSLPKTGHISVNVYDLNGRHVAKLIDAKKTAGNHIVKWNGNKFSSGIYFVVLSQNQNSMVRQIVLLR
jgi:hypothetical protein